MPLRHSVRDYFVNETHELHGRAANQGIPCFESCLKDGTLSGEGAKVRIRVHLAAHVEVVFCQGRFATANVCHLATAAVLKTQVSNAQTAIGREPSSTFLFVAFFSGERKQEQRKQRH